MLSGGTKWIKMNGKDVGLSLSQYYSVRRVARIAYQYANSCGTSRQSKRAICGKSNSIKDEQLRRIAVRKFLKQGYAFRLRFRTIIARERSIKKLFRSNYWKFSPAKIRALFNGTFKIVAKTLGPPRKIPGRPAPRRRPSGGISTSGLNRKPIILKKVTLKSAEKRAVKRALSAAARKIYHNGSLRRFANINWDQVPAGVKTEFAKVLARYRRSIRKVLRIYSSDPAGRKHAAASVLYVSYFTGVAFVSVPQPNKPTTPTLTHTDLMQIAKAVKGALTTLGSLHGYKSIRALALAIKGKKLAWHKYLNHPTHLMLLNYLNKTMTGPAKPGRMYPNQYSDSQTNQRTYASWLLHRYVDHLSKPPPKLTKQQLVKIGAALEMTRRRYRRKIGHGSLTPLTCALRRQLNIKWRWYKLASRVHRYLVSMLNKTMPGHLKPKTRHPVSAGSRRAYARWLLIKYVRYTKLQAPPASTLVLSEKQKRLYLKYAVLPAVRKAGATHVRQPVEARRYLIWAKYTSLSKLPNGLNIKLSRTASKLLKRRQFSSIRQEIAYNRRQYCPSGSEKTMNAMYRNAIWNPVALADAKAAKQRAKPARVEAVALTPQQKKLILAAVLKGVNKWRTNIGKTPFRSAAQVKGYLRRNAKIWKRLESHLNSTLIQTLGALLRGKKISKLYRQLVIMGRASPRMAYNSAVFDTNVGYITVARRKLPGKTVVAKPTVALKPLQLSRRALSIARRRLLRAWNTTRTLHTNLPKYRSSKKLASYLKSHDDRLKKEERDWLITAFTNVLNAGYLRSIKPKVKAPTKQAEFTKRVYIAVLKAAEVTFAPVVIKLTPPVTSRPRPANMQLALQRGLVAAVRKVYGASKSESYAISILKTQKWSTLKQLGIISHIQTAFSGLGYRRAAKNSYLARRLVKKTLRNWKRSSATTTHTPVTPARPITPAPRPTDKQVALQNALVAAVRSVYGASKSESYAKTILKTQKWSTLKQLGIVSYVQAAFRGLGYRRAARNSYLAHRLVKKTLRNWKRSSVTTTHTPVTPSRRTTPAPRTSDRQIALQNALVAAVRSVYGASKSETYAKTILKTQKWSTLKQLGVSARIQAAFGRYGYTAASRNSRVARRLLKQTLVNWR